MTRLAILADIHGNLPALEAVMADMAPFQVEHVVVAGDLVNWGPFSAEVMEVVTREGWTVIRGNNEYYLLDYNTVRQPPHWAEWALLPWLYDQLKGKWHTVIAAMPDELSLRYPDAPPIRVVHGCPGNPWKSIHYQMTDEEVLEELEKVPESVLIGAHSHLAMSRYVGDRHVLNPGSVGVPLDGQFTASYMILDGDATGWHPTFRRIPFDYEPLFAEYERQRFIEGYGVEAELVVKEFRTARLQVHPYQMWRGQHFKGQPSSYELLEQYLQVDPWLYCPPQYQINPEEDTNATLL